MKWHEHNGEHTASANAGGVKVLCGVGPHDGRFLAWCVVAYAGEEWASWSPMMAESVEAGKQLAEARAETTLEPRVVEGEAAGAVLKAMGVK